MRQVLLLPLVISLFVLGVLAFGSERSSDLKQPLDLPSGSGSVEEEEDSPESIVFYGMEIEGQSFHFCLAAYAW